MKVPVASELFENSNLPGPKACGGRYDSFHETLLQIPLHF